MVRFKNRYLIVEFVQPSNASTQLLPTPIEAGPSRPSFSRDEEDLGDDDDDEEDESFARIPDLPFLLPPIPDLSNLRDSDEAGKGIYRAVRDMVQDVFGDEGWGRVSSSFRVVYHSPLTTITLVRIARPHVRTLHAAITLLSTLDGRPVLPRVIGVSGTVKKAQSRITAYHRMTIAQVLARLEDGSKIREKDQLGKRAEAEQTAIQALDD